MENVTVTNRVIKYHPLNIGVSFKYWPSVMVPNRTIAMLRLSGRGNYTWDFENFSDAERLADHFVFEDWDDRIAIPFQYQIVQPVEQGYRYHVNALGEAVIVFDTETDFFKWNISQ